MKKHRVKVRYVFEGFFDVMAEDKAEAGSIIKRDCGLVMGGSIHTCNDEQVRDWKFSIHPETRIISTKHIKSS